jgi:hypothetical protein
VPRGSLWGLFLVTALLAGCSSEPGTSSPPRGYVRTLQVEAGTRVYGFGPFVGYHFRPKEHGDMGRVAFVCYNERQFYTTSLPDGALLFEGEAVLAELPAEVGEMPAKGGRIRPVFFDEVPEAWLATRPEPADAFRHFHSCHDAQGAVRLGYWLRHVAKAGFTYDMGGRVGQGSPLYHEVEPGLDLEFAGIVEFDNGPDHRRQ